MKKSVKECKRKRLNMTLAELKSIKKSYLQAGQEVAVLKDINLTVEATEFIAVTGPSGSGKSTLLNILGCLLLPSSGSYFFKGTDIAFFDEKSRALFRNHSIGFIFQDHKLLPQFTALENILLPVLAAENSVDNIYRERADYLLEQTGMENLAGRYPGQLSGGESQRIAICRSLIMNPSLILADEPTGALDQTTALNIIELLNSLRQTENTAVIMVTHARLIADMAEKRYALEDGALKQW